MKGGREEGEGVGEGGWEEGGKGTGNGKEGVNE